MHPAETASQPDDGEDDMHDNVSQYQAPENRRFEDIVSLAPSVSVHPVVLDMRSSSPSLRASSSIESFGDGGSGGRRRINKVEMRRRLLDRHGSPNSRSASPLLGSDRGSEERIQDSQDEREDKDRLSIITATTDFSTETAIIGHAERKTLSGTDTGEGSVSPRTGNYIDFEPETKFGLGDFDLGAVDGGNWSSVASTGIPNSTRMNEEKPDSIYNGSMKMGEVDVDMDMRSALDRLMDDVAGTKVDNSMVTDEDDSYGHQYPPSSSSHKLIERAATDSALLHNDFASRDASASSALSLPPPVPPKDNIRSREQMILEKRREARRLEDGEFAPGKIGRAKRGQELLGVGRPTRRRSMSTGDVQRNSKAVLLDVGSKEAEGLGEHLGDSIEKELQKLEDVPDTQSKTVRFYLFHMIMKNLQVLEIPGP